MSTPINAYPANPVASKSKVDTHNLSPQCECDTDRSVSQLQEPDEDDLSNSYLSQEDDQDDEAAIDLSTYSKIAYHHDGDAHGVKYVCEGRGRWTPIVGKRLKYKVPIRLPRLRAPPHIQATLQSSDSESDSDLASDCSLSIPPWC